MDLTVADINGDGRLDVATVAGVGGEVAWWESLEAGFSRKLIRTGFDGGRSIRAGDLDKDGDTDLIAASLTLNRIEWYENDGSEKFTTRMIDPDFKGAHTVQLFDLDQDGDMDIICSGWDNSAAPSEMAWWQNNGSQVFTKKLIATGLDQAPFIEPTDVDGDGDFDFIGTDEITGEVYWWENNGSLSFIQHLIDGQFNLAHTVNARDLDRDGDPDILGSACTSGLQAWYENQGGGVFRKNAMENLSGAIWLDMADFDSDGDMDMVGTGMGANQLALYSNNGQQRFTRSWIPGGLTSGFALQVVDFDRDGDMDIVAIGYASNYLGWWENTTSLTALMQHPSWMTPGLQPDEYFVVDSDRGNIVKTKALEVEKGWVNPGYCQDIVRVGNKVYACAGAFLNVYDLATGIKESSFRSDAQLLYGIEAGSEVLWITAPLDGKVLSFNISTSVFSILSEGLSYPSALCLDPESNQLLILDGESTVAVKELNPISAELKTLENTQIAAGGDIVTNGSGTFFISSPQSNSLFVNKSHWVEPTQEFLTNLNGPWGMIYEPQSMTLVVSMNGSGKIERFSAALSSISEIILYKEFVIYPNPFVEKIFVEGLSPATIKSIRIFSLSGAQIQPLNFSLDNETVILDHPSGSRNGFFTIVIETDQGRFSRKIMRSGN